MAEETYVVAREHLGDKEYAVGDERVADPNDVAHLVDKGVLVKAEAPVKTKVEAKSPNKAEA